MMRRDGAGSDPSRRGGPWIVLGLFLLALAAPLFVPLSASADATVKVRVLRGRQPVEATVTLTLSSGQSRSCETRNGVCQMEIPGGQHFVRAQPRGEGRPSPDRRVTVPPSGEVTLLVHVP